MCLESKGQTTDRDTTVKEGVGPDETPPDSPPGPAQPRGRLWKGRAVCREGKLGTQLSILGHNLKGRIIPHS